MFRLEKFNHSTFYFFGLIVLVVGLPWSPFLISLAQAILLANWILEGNFIEKMQILFNRKSALFFISIFLLHLLGTLYSEDVSLAFKDIKIKLPMFIFPLVMATTKPITLNQLKTILNFFIATIFVSSFISLLALFGYTNHEIIDIRDISLFISHIRFSLLINIGLFSSAYLLFDCKKTKLYLCILYGFITIWFIVFLFILQSLTGIVVFIVTTVFFLIRWIYFSKRKSIRNIGIVMLVIALFVLIGYFLKAYNRFYSIDDIAYENLEERTAQGNKYTNKVEAKAVENGHFVWLYVCEKELKEEWEKRSELKYEEKDFKGHHLKVTLIRYLTSKGYRKDAEGVRKLEDKEIGYIENGIANYIYVNHLGIYPRIYQILWEIEQYKQGGNPSGHSVTQRFEYYKSAMHIFKKNMLIGVGTGDVKHAFDEYYIKSDSRLTEKWRLRAHNQHITFLITFGIIGFLWISFSFVYSIIKEDGFKNYFFIFFFFIAFLSMINEDTLETQAGATFFAYFYSLFLFAYKTKKQNSINQEKTEGND